jgi:hypothetical protein
LQLGSSDGGVLIIETDGRPEPFYWQVTIETPGLSVKTDVDLDHLQHRVPPLDGYFAALATDWRGWSGARTWGTRPLTLSATHDGLGHIAVVIALEQIRDRDEWSVQATITLDAGQLDAAARQASQLTGI